MSNPLFKFITKTATSAASSIVTGELKRHAKGFIEKYTAKSPETARREAMTRLGYETDHYVLDKNNDVKFKSSSLLVHEWLIKSPPIVGKVTKDEENGTVYFDGLPITNAVTVDLLGKFAKATGINTPALNGHFKQALELLDVTDFTSLKFEREFSGWDPIGRSSVIDAWLGNVFGSVEGTALATDEKYATMLFRKWVVGTARRAMKPGETLDGCFVLQGPAGVGKTQFFRKLLPEPFDNRTGEVYCDVRSPRKFVEAIVGKTIANFDELSVLENPKSDEIFKQLLSSQFIDVRLAWARKPRRYDLRQGFAATTNKDKFIADRFLSRRLWVVQLNGSRRMNFDYMNANRRSLWMEAVYCARRGDSCILSTDEQKVVEKHNERF